MPTYEYKREDSTTFEIIQKMSDDPLTNCPTTAQNVRRIVTGGGGVVYKGEGWYVTDYKNGGKKESNEGNIGWEYRNDGVDIQSGNDQAAEYTLNDENEDRWDVHNIQNKM